MAKRGPKPTLPAVKTARGTDRPCRDTYEILDAPSGDVQPPTDLPYAAVVIWHEFAPTAMAMGTLKPADSATFAQWCVMTANIQASWQPSNDAAPASYIQQWRTLGELFGLAGEKSRLALKVIDGDRPSTNPFKRNGRRP